MTNISITNATMRECFTATASALLEEDNRIALLFADIGTDRFAPHIFSQYGHRVVNAGIREQTLIGMAAGYALAGFRPIAHSYAPFLVERAYEQLKLDLNHQDVGAILVSVGASYDWAAGGYSHHAPADVGLIALLPGWRIYVPGHVDEVQAQLRRAAASDERVYIRLSEAMNGEGFTRQGDAMQVVRADRAAMASVIAVGPMLGPVLSAAADLPVNILYTNTVRPFDAATVQAICRTMDVVLVEPYAQGTCVAELSEAMSDRPVRIHAIGVPREELRQYGERAEHDAAHGLDAAGLHRRLAAVCYGVGA
ncbi:MAG: transketolase [Gammaproteobacteria bacterium]|nr:transketolase [Gammaproteobacteria bacterium]